MLTLDFNQLRNYASTQLHYLTQTARQRLPEVARWSRDFFANLYRISSDAISHYGMRMIQWSDTHARLAYARIAPVATSFFAASQRIAINHGGTAIKTSLVAFGIWRLYSLWKNRTIYPTVRLVSSLHKADLEITTPNVVKSPTNVTLTFCIDTSGSMRPDDRLGAIQRALDRVCTHAQTVVNQSDAQIRFAIVKFANTATVVADITSVTKGGDLASLKNQVASLRADGSTSIEQGLRLAAQPFQKMAKDRNAKHYVVLLTDGEDTLNPAQISTIKSTFSSAHFFAIGIGSSHTKKTLRDLTPHYFDTTQQGCTIEETIQKIYEQAISDYTAFALSTLQLTGEQWSAAPLTSLKVGEQKRISITLHPDRFKEPFDLSTLWFQLKFTDYRGRDGTISIPWNPHPMVIPSVLQHL